jgi:hypothetical protein
MIDLRLRALYICLMLNGDSALLLPDAVMHGRGARASAIRSRRGKTYFAPMIHGPGACLSGRGGGARVAEPAQPEPEPEPAQPEPEPAQPEPEPARARARAEPARDAEPARVTRGERRLVDERELPELARGGELPAHLPRPGADRVRVPVHCQLRLLLVFYPVRAEEEAETSVVAFLVTSNIIAIDLCIAFFVICGFVAAYTHANMTEADCRPVHRVLRDLRLRGGVHAREHDGGRLVRVCEDREPVRAGGPLAEHVRDDADRVDFPPREAQLLLPGRDDA